MDFQDVDVASVGWITSLIPLHGYRKPSWHIIASVRMRLYDSRWQVILYWNWPQACENYAERSPTPTYNLHTMFPPNCHLRAFGKRLSHDAPGMCCSCFLSQILSFVGCKIIKNDFIHVVTTLLTFALTTVNPTYTLASMQACLLPHVLQRHSLNGRLYEVTT